MNGQYFEQLEEQERRHAEWRMLDLALAACNEAANHRLRVMFGHFLIRVGARLADENPMMMSELRESRHSLN